MIDKEQVLRDWDEVVLNHPVPRTLHEHQIDAMSLLQQGKNVFLGKYPSPPLKTLIIITFHLAVPTGSGKTLPQLATILTMRGTALVIPMLQTIQERMPSLLSTHENEPD